MKTGQALPCSLCQYGGGGRREEGAEPVAGHRREGINK